MELESIVSILSAVSIWLVVGIAMYVTFRKEKPKLEFKIGKKDNFYYVSIRNYSFRKVAVEISSSGLGLKKLLFQDEISENNGFFNIPLIEVKENKNVKDFKVIELISGKRYRRIKYEY